MFLDKKDAIKTAIFITFLFVGMIFYVYPFHTYEVDLYDERIGTNKMDLICMDNNEKVVVKTGDCYEFRPSSADNVYSCFVVNGGKDYKQYKDNFFGKTIEENNITVGEKDKRYISDCVIR